MRHHLFSLPFALLPAFTGALAYAPEARACGGMFCSQTSPTPIDQSAEKILFEVNADGSVTATVEIKYNGDPQDFAWIVPVSGTPDFVEVAEKDELLLLDAATRPSIIPPTTLCTNPPAQPFGLFTAGCDAEALSGGFDRALPVAPNEDDGGVNVTNYPSAGPFDGIVVVEGNNPDVLMAWLRDHDYQVTEEMRPFIEQYTLEGYSFLATRLQADAEVNDMVPIRFHCPQPNPEIPLRLTAIAAEPDMGFLVFVAGPSRYELAPGYENVALGTDELQASFGVTNYFALVSKKIDEAGGRGFVVERAEDASASVNGVDATFLGTETEQVSRDSLRARLTNKRFVTRFYARMSADEMLVDPVFVPAAGGDVPFASFDLSSRTYEACPPEGEPATQPPSPPTCGTLYCGDGDACALADLGLEGCVCRGDHVARVTTSPAGGSQIVCMSPEIDVHGGAGNPCAGNTCGAGTCLPVNDRPTCKCNDGAVAVLVNNSVVCTGIDGAVFESDQILWPAPAPLDADGDGIDDVTGADLGAPSTGGCTASSRANAGGAASLAFLFASVALMRRVLRRR